MSKEDGKLLERKLKYMGLKGEEAIKAMGVSPEIAKMMKKGQVLCGKVQENLKIYCEGMMIKKFGRKFLGKCLKEKREEKGLSQIALANKFKVSHDVIFKLENGDMTVGNHYEKVFKLLE